VLKALQGKSPNFRVITLQEPRKSEMIPFLEKEHLGQSGISRPERTARVQVTIRGDSGLIEMVELFVDLDSASVAKKEHLVGKHPYIDSAYMQAAEKACRADPRIQAEVEKMKLPSGATVVVEPWAYATDGMNDMTERTTMVSISYSVGLGVFRAYSNSEVSVTSICV
jgi:primary-amine oxidase